MKEDVLEQHIEQHDFDFDQEWAERQESEISVLECVYSTEELRCDTDSKGVRQIVRRLRLPHPSPSDAESQAVVELILTLTPKYPNPGTVLLIDARVARNDGGRRVRPASLPGLLGACRTEAAAYAVEGTEAAMAVLVVADAWADVEWQSIAPRQMSADDVGSAVNVVGAGVAATPGDEFLGRRMVYSHHIIAQSKRKAISQLASELKLGGYFKIGWPGIIMIEGSEENCIAFVDSIRRMRWQYITVRGEQQVKLRSAEFLDDRRLFHKKMEELGKDQMSFLAGKCREVGLEKLFKTALKIYEDEERSDPEELNESVHGVVAIVDHMNDPKNYHKRLKGLAKGTDCRLVLRHCPVPRNGRSVTAIVLGSAIGTKQFLKRWRTCAVDVDRRGSRCLERMLDVVAEGEVESTVWDSNTLHNLLISCGETVSAEDMSSICKFIGGDKWSSAWLEAVGKT